VGSLKVNKTIAFGMIVFGVIVCVVGLDSKESAAQTRPASTQGIARAKEMTLDLGDKLTLKLVQIPAGKFLMGSPETEEDRYDDEDQHEVTISRAFYMGVTDVTVDQFAAFAKAFAKDSGYRTEAERAGSTIGMKFMDGKAVLAEANGCSWRNPSIEQKGDHPVVQVSWNDAEAFCDWLSKKSGKTVALPTEAQWEYARRAGTKTKYTWGDNPDDGKGLANCADQAFKRKFPNQVDQSYFNWEDSFVFTSPVASFKPNAFGLYDMDGNVMQWCQDRWGLYPKGPATDPTGAVTGDKRVLRGGSWSFGPRNCRAAYRGSIRPEYRTDSYGFRVVVAFGAHRFSCSGRRWPEGVVVVIAVPQRAAIALSRRFLGVPCV
jgi:formylglycine-generating enzyme required for sulfatase activity